MKIATTAIPILIALSLVGCASIPIESRLAEADNATLALPTDIPRYNAAARALCEAVDSPDPATWSERLTSLGVRLTLPDTDLPLVAIRVIAISDRFVTGSIGTPLVLEFDTASHPLHPPEGLYVNATAIYSPAPDGPRLRILTSTNEVDLFGGTYPLATVPNAAGNELAAQARKLRATGFVSMIRPLSLERKPQIYLLDPYDPAKVPLLMVHGLQSTPVAFATLVNALRSDPVTRERYQLWQFYYPSGNPLLANAAALRDSLATTLATLDPADRDPATQRLVVLGHSMGGVISHTLVSDSGEALWSSVFSAPPEKLKGDPETIKTLRHLLTFDRNPRVERVIFMAAPHRGSPIADNLLGRFGTTLTRLAPIAESGFAELARANEGAITPAARAFYADGRFSAVRTLSANSPALSALAELPIPVPFHSIIGWKGDAPLAKSSDGVVPYASSNLHGATSETVVPSGHNVINHPDAIVDVIRLLQLIP